MDQTRRSHPDRSASSRNNTSTTSNYYFANQLVDSGSVHSYVASSASISRQTNRSFPSQVGGEGGGGSGGGFGEHNANDDDNNDDRRRYNTGFPGALRTLHTELYRGVTQQDGRFFPHQPSSQGVIPPRSRARVPLISDLSPRREYRLLSRLGDPVRSGGDGDGDGGGEQHQEGALRYNEEVNDGSKLLTTTTTTTRGECYQHRPTQSSYHLLPRPHHQPNAYVDTQPTSSPPVPATQYEAFNYLSYPSPSPDPLAPTPRFPLPLTRPWDESFRSERTSTTGGITFRDSNGTSYTPSSPPRSYQEDQRQYNTSNTSQYLVVPSHHPTHHPSRESIGSITNSRPSTYPSNPPIASSSSSSTTTTTTTTTNDLRIRCPTPDLLYILDPNEPPPPQSSSSRLNYADIIALEQQRAEAAIWKEQDQFRKNRKQIVETKGIESLTYIHPTSLLRPIYPVVFASPSIGRDSTRYSQPGIHIIPQPINIDPLGRMPPRKAVAARPRAAAAAAAASAAAAAGMVVGGGAGTGTEVTNSGRRKEVHLIGGKETSVTILSDSEDPVTNGSTKVIQPTISVPRRRAPVRAAAQATVANAQANAIAQANGNGTAGSSTRKRKVADDDSASVVGPASKRVGKVNGKAATSASSATQSTIATAIGASATEAVMNSYKQKHPALNHVPPPTLASGSGAVVLGQTTVEGPPWDDKDGHYIVQPNTLFGIKDRYRIIRLLGQGTFGKVVEAREQATNRKVAIKIIRAVQKYRDASSIEIRVLQALRKGDPTNIYKCIHLLETFDFRNHVCLVSELFGMSVFDFLKENKFQPFPERHIQDFAKSLLKSLSYVHSLKLIHTDLKPENILLVHNGYDTIGDRRANAKQKHILKNPDIRLIDFGSATFSNEFHSSVVSTRHYRAPEIILGLGWSFPCDMFSIGCILVEFFTGDALFQTHDNLEHLAMMEVVMGKMPQAMAHKASKVKGEFFKGLKLDYPNSATSKNSRKFVKNMVPLRESIHPSTPLRREFLDLIERLLAFDPAKRITVDQALAHQYLREATPSLPTSL